MYQKVIACAALLLTTVYPSYAQILKSANWISAGENSDSDKVVYFERKIHISKPLRSAVLEISATGIYEASLNNRRVGKYYFTPGYTAYQKRLQYQHYDITRQIKEGLNELSVSVGNGWWNWTFRDAEAQPMLIAAIKLTYQDGSQELISTDANWQSGSGPIRNDDLYQGELYDATVKPGHWKPVQLLNINKDNLVPTTGNPVIKQESFHPIKIWSETNSAQIADFGQNMAGWASLKLTGKAGDTVKVYYGETLDKDGRFYNGNLRAAKATDTFVLNGEQQVYEPHFTYHGFRYIKVTGAKLDQKNTIAVALYSDLKPNGTFTCSNPKLNQLNQNIVWSMKSNFFDIPTDCPQRSERLGWTLDADVFCATASYLMNVKDFYQKWLLDLAAEQHTDGSVTATVPVKDWSHATAGWSDAATFTPWTLYNRYGDQSVLQIQYASMKAWVDYLFNSTPDMMPKDKGFITFADWLPMGPNTDKSYLGLCYWYRSTWIVARAAQILGNETDAIKYTQLAKKLKTAFDERYTSKIPDTQTAYCVGIQFGLLPADSAKHLAKLVQANGNKLATGFMGTPYLLHALSDNGYADVAYNVLLQEQMPSWLYMVNKGATTIWEGWDAIQQDGTIKDLSLNHYAFGSVGAWMYENIAGIKPLEPGYKKIRIKPLIGGNLTWAKGSYQCSYGEISSAWTINDNQFTLNVTIPKGTTAEIWLPSQHMREVKSGQYHFTTRLKQSNQLTETEKS